MNFNPQKPFGKISGQHEKFPLARFQQGGLFFDAHRKCLNPTEAEPEKEETTDDAVADATDDLRKKVSKEADKALLKLQAAKTNVEAESTPVTKTAYTKALNAYNKVQAKLEGLA